MILRVINIGVGGFGPLKNLELCFSDTVTCIVGPNGCGKSTLLQLIAGLCGTDEASELIAGQEVAYCEMVVDLDGEEHIFTINKRFDEDAIMEFKAKLYHRVNFPLTQYRETFISECCEIVTAKESFFRHCSTIDVEPQFIYTPVTRTASFESGDGVKQAFSLFLNDSLDGIPTLYDCPELHQHLCAQRSLLKVLVKRDRQLLYATHSPDMVWQGGKCIDFDDYSG